MRLFLAIIPPKNVLDQLRDVQRNFSKDKRNLKNIPVDQLHVTLKFLGSNVSEASRDLIVDTLRGYEGSLKDAEVTLNSIQFGFPHQTFPKILMANVESTNSLVSLSNDVHEIIKNLKLRDTIRWKDRHSENFHISLSRLKLNATKSTARSLATKAKTMKLPQFQSFIAEEFFLIESSTDKGMIIYRKIERFKLSK